jgi:hypothetical protein
VKALIAFAAGVAVCTVVAWTTAVPAAPIAQRAAATAAPEVPRTDTALLAAAAKNLRAHDPFRLERKPAGVRYNPWETASTAAPVAAPARPGLSLVGLVGGPPWNALVEGIPGHEPGVLLQLGDSAGGIRFVRLAGDTVLLAGFDTTWALTSRRAWQ